MIKSKENKLIKQYRTNPDEFIKEKIANIYMNKIHIYAISLVKKYFPCHANNLEECHSICYFTLDNLLNTYDIRNSQFSFETTLITIVRTQILNYYRSISAYREYYQSCTKAIASSSHVDNELIPHNQVKSSNDNSFIFNHIMKSSRKACKKSKKVLYYKLNGYKNKEIAKKLKINTRKVAVVYHYLMKAYVMRNKRLLKTTNYLSF